MPGGVEAIHSSPRLDVAYVLSLCRPEMKNYRHLHRKTVISWLNVRLGNEKLRLSPIVRGKWESNPSFKFMAHCPVSPNTLAPCLPLTLSMKG
jgi:hypothetical protein